MTIFAPQILARTRQPLVASGPSLSLDAAISDTTFTAGELHPITLTQASGVLIVAVWQAGNSVTVIPAATGITFVEVTGSPVDSSTADRVQVWAGQYSGSPGSINVGLTMSGAVFHQTFLLAIAGATAVDGTPGTSSSTDPSITTTRTNGIAAFVETNSGGETAGSGWTAFPGLSSANPFWGEYQISPAGTYNGTVTGGTRGGSILGVK